MSHDLAARLKIFVDAGLIRRVPTRWQLLQGEIQMTPYVMSTDATAEHGYVGARFGHPLVRQPLIFSQVGIDHVKTGSGLGVRLPSLCTHLHLTYHQGMPVFDLQIVQTHPHGLDTLRRQTEELLTGATRRARRTNRLASLILTDPRRYHEKLLGHDGWIARAERFDYPGPEAEDSLFPPEFFSLVGLVNYSAATFAERPREIGWARVPGHLARLAGRRFRERGGFGWFALSASGR